MGEIRIIVPQATYTVRQPVLRPGKAVQSCHFDGDFLETTFHFGYFDGDLLVGVASVYEVRNNLFGRQKQLQLRGMAVLETHQKKRIGDKLLNEVQKWAIAQHFGFGLMRVNRRLGFILKTVIKFMKVRL